MPVALCSLRCAPPVGANPLVLCFGGLQQQQQWRRHHRRHAPAPAASAASSSEPDVTPTAQAAAPDASAEQSPWHMGFQCNERYLQWDDSAQRQLIFIWVAQQLDITLDQLTERVAELTLLLPDLNAKLGRLQAKLVLKLVEDLPQVTQRILELRRLLPSLNLSAMLAQYPWMLTSMDPADVERQLAALAAALPPNVNIEKLVEAEPMLLRADISAVLAELRRLLPGQDAVKVLLADPSGCLDMQSAGLKASLEIDDGIKSYKGM